MQNKRLAGVIGVLGILIVVSFFFAPRQMRHQELASRGETPVEAASWVFITNPSSATLIKNFGFMKDPDAAAIAPALTAFNEAMKNPVANDAQVLKADLTARIDQFCSGFSNDQNMCETAQLMLHILSKDSTSEFKKALPGLRLFAHLKEMPKIQDQIEFLKRLEKKKVVGSMAFNALRIKQAQLALKMGSFQQAQDVLSEKDIKGPKQTLPIETKEIVCRIEALHECDLHKDSVCLADQAWQDFNKGCHEKTPPRKSEAVAMQLGYWWAQSIHQQTIRNRDAWETAKRDLSSKITKGDEFSRDTYTVLDFTLSVRSEFPRELVDRATKISPDNFLWGWAHKQALQVFGNQWAYLMKPSDQSRLAQFNLFAPGSQRNLASEGDH